MTAMAFASAALLLVAGWLTDHGALIACGLVLVGFALLIHRDVRHNRAVLYDQERTL